VARPAFAAGALTGLFALTLFVSSALLFLVQPMFAKMVLPLLGGAPAVWNTCMVFFQTALLAGYAYAWIVPGWLGIRRHAAVHVGLLLVTLVLLPITIPGTWHPPRETNPIPWLFGVLTIAVGLPFFVLSANAPLLQRWFAETGHPAARDPYFLYGASNMGSLLALLGYPILLEPSLSLSACIRLWSAGYGVLLVLMTSCAFMLWRAAPAAESKRSSSFAHARAAEPHANWRLRRRWVVLAFVPSSLMLSVTTYLTTDIAAIPLLWVIPLALYLLTFILAFARRSWLPYSAMARILPVIVLVLTFVMLSEATEPVWLLVSIHLLALFVTGIVCHAQLAAMRPAAIHLGEFYLWLSVGGVLGGLFNGLIAPLVFRGVAEYPLVLVLACLLRPADPAAGPRRNAFTILDFVLPASLCVITMGLVLVGQAFGPRWGLEPGPASVAVMFAVPAVICYTFLHRPLRFGLGIGALLLAGSLYHGVHGAVLYQTRSFFGVHRVTIDQDRRFRQLVHGNTFHGQQSLDPSRRGEPLAYFYRTGPIGQVFAAFSASDVKTEVALIGLGAGSLAAYGQPGQRLTYYEIDPSVLRIARDPRYFSFLADSRGDVHVLLGDARLTLGEARDRQYGLIVIDAFSSDAIPLHLLTREALSLYLAKLAGDGLLAFHISNRYLDLEPVLARLAGDAGLRCLTAEDLQLSEEEKKRGKFPSQWLVMARDKAHFGRLAVSGRWREARLASEIGVWTDDFSNIFSVFKWH
jgi:hypothetical protein